jgi:hypothetical protein
MNNSIGGAIAVLVNCLAKQLNMWLFLKYTLTECHVGRGETERSHYFWLSHPKAM